MFEHVITSLAILKVNWDKGQDYIENFVPFVAECLRTAAQDEVSLPELQDAISDKFGFKIPEGALKTILIRAARRHGYVQRTKGIYRRNEQALASLDYPRMRAVAARQHNALIAKLVQFCEARYEISWSQEEAEVALLTYIEHRSMPILLAAVEGEAIPTPPRRTRNGDYLVNAFIAHLCKADPEGFDFLETVVKGSMLADVLFYPELSRVEQHFGRVELYFDTPFLLRALGLEGPSVQAPCRELMRLLYELDGEIRCFEHTVEEIEGVLHSAAYALQDPERLRHTYYPTLEYFISSNYRASDVELAIARLRQSLRSLRVQVKPKPPYKDWLGVDEDKLESILQEEVRYFSEKTLRHDLDSLTAIHRLRGGQSPYNIESCSAIFVTTNLDLARAGVRFFREEYGKGPMLVPHCVLDHVLTTIVWLKKPTSVPDLPRKKIIADCYAALNPPDPLWRRYLEEAQRLQEKGDISEEDYDLLRFSSQAKRLLMDSTLGETAAFVEGTVQEILEKAHATVRAEAEAALEAEKKKRLEAERRVAEAERQFEAQLDRFRSIGARGGYWIGRVAFGVGVVVLAIGIYCTLSKPFLGRLEEWKGFIALASSVAVAIASGWSLVYGTTLKSLVRRLEIDASRRIEQTLTRIAIPRNM